MEEVAEPGGGPAPQPKAGGAEVAESGGQLAWESERSEDGSPRPGGMCFRGTALEGPVTFFDRFHISFWLAALCVPVSLLVLSWSLLADMGCRGAGPAGHDGARQDVQWFTWVWDMVYIIVATMTAVCVSDALYFAPCAANWGNKLRVLIHVPSAAVSMAFCVGVKVAILEWELHTLIWAWLLVKHVVILVSAVAFVAALLCAMWRTPGRDARAFAFRRWCVVFAFAVWVLAFYLMNQLFVRGYVELARLTQRHRFSTPVIGLIDFTVALFWSVVWVPCWAVAGGVVMEELKRPAPAVHKDRLHLALLLWVELFDTCFGRLVFEEVQIEPIMMMLLLKDSVTKVLDLAFRYMPLRMVRLAMRTEDDKRSWCFLLFKRLFALLLGVDLHVVVDCCCCGRSDHHYERRNSPGCGANLEELSSSGGLHRYHIKRARWREFSFAEGAGGDLVADAGIPAGALDWTSAMERYEDFGVPVHRADTHLEPRMMAINRAVEACKKSHELSEAALPRTTRSLKSVQAKRSDFLQCCGCNRQVAGVLRKELKEFLAFTWNLERWCSLDDLEAEALCDRICLVQRNLHLKFVAVCLPRMTSSSIGISFVLLRRHFPCACLALGVPARAEARELRLWAAIALLDALEVAAISWTHWRHNLEQHDHRNWHRVRRVLWGGWFMLLAAAVSAHVLQDTYYSFYRAAF